MLIGNNKAYHRDYDALEKEREKLQDFWLPLKSLFTNRSRITGKPESEVGIRYKSRVMPSASSSLPFCPDSFKGAIPPFVSSLLSLYLSRDTKPQIIMMLPQCLPPKPVIVIELSNYLAILPFSNVAFTIGIPSTRWWPTPHNQLLKCVNLGLLAWNHQFW